MTKLKKLKNKNLKYSYVQGRFSNEVAGKFQHFPIHNWENEFYYAKKLNFDSVEWIITDFSNPIFNTSFIKLIKKNLSKHSIVISSISLDLIMDNPLHKLTKSESLWLSNKIYTAVKFFKIKRVSIPIEERSRFNNKIEKMSALKNLSIIYNVLKKKCKVCIETDISPRSLINIFNMKKFSQLGILLDLGNTRAHGFDIEEYFKYFSNRIYSIHIKFRDKSYGKTKILKRKKFYDLNYLIKNLHHLKKLVDISFQTYKTNKYFLSDMKRSIKNYNYYVK